MPYGAEEKIGQGGVNKGAVSGQFRVDGNVVIDVDYSLGKELGKIENNFNVGVKKEGGQENVEKGGG